MEEYTVHEKAPARIVIEMPHRLKDDFQKICTKKFTDMSKKARELIAGFCVEESSTTSES